MKAEPITCWHQRRSDDDYSRPNDQRAPYERDKARVLHSAAFRRLQAKTQILGVGQNDFYRTRLTHSLEVAQIGISLLPQLRLKYPQLSDSLSLDDRLMEAVCLAHDIGHPPFGHGGEVALNYMMRDHGGFEGNGQTLRILAVLEPYTEHLGMNLSRRTLLGLLKYPNTWAHCIAISGPPNSERHLIKIDDWEPPKGIFDDDNHILQWILAPLSDHDRNLFQSHRPGRTTRHHNKTRYKSVDASIMEIADDIAYGVHDLEDAIVVGNTDKEQWYNHALPRFHALGDKRISDFMDDISDKLFSSHHRRKQAIGQLVNILVTAVQLQAVEQEFEEKLLHYNAVLPSPEFELLDILKKV